MRSFHFLTPILATCIACGCSSKHGVASQSSGAVDTTRDAQDTARFLPASWSDRAVQRYIAESHTELIEAGRQSGLAFSWMLDRIEPTDSAVFKVVQIGHDQSEPDGSEQRFVTDAWIYLDTVGQRIYEYDLPNDSLIRWK